MLQNTATLRIACVGDSLTRGDGSHEGRTQHPARGNYPAALQRLLGDSYIVRNFGHGGATSCNASDVPFESTRAFRRAKAFRPHVAVLMLGTNDAKQKHWTGLCLPGADYLLSGLRRISSALRPSSRGPRAALLLVSPPPILKERWGIRRALILRAVNAIRRHAEDAACQQTRRRSRKPLGNPPPCELGSTYLTPSLPFWSEDATARRASFVDDGIHLNRQGSQRLAAVVRDALRETGCLNVSRG